jgi:hypothetical protein
MEGDGGLRLEEHQAQAWPAPKQRSCGRQAKDAAADDGHIGPKVAARRMPRMSVDAVQVIRRL